MWNCSTDNYCSRTGHRLQRSAPLAQEPPVQWRRSYSSQGLRVGSSNVRSRRPLISATIVPVSVPVLLVHLVQRLHHIQPPVPVPVVLSVHCHRSCWPPQRNVATNVTAAARGTRRVVVVPDWRPRHNHCPSVTFPSRINITVINSGPCALKTYRHRRRHSGLTMTLRVGVVPAHLTTWS